MTLASLRELHAIIGRSIADIEKHYEAEGLDFPDLNAYEFVEDRAYKATLDDAIVGPTNLIIAAADQLIATVRRPVEAMSDASQAYQLSCAFRVAIETGCVELLSEAGQQGLSVEQIGARIGVEPTKIARILRVLATNHFFRELTPGVFANNRPSSYLHKGKSFDEVHKHPDEMFNDVKGAAAAYASYTATEVFRSSAYMLETITDPIDGKSDDPAKSPFSRAYNTSDAYYKYIEAPERKQMITRLGAAVRAASLWVRPDAVCTVFPWKDLPEGSIILDVGGGLGAPVMPLAKAFPHLKIIIEDRESQLEDTKKFYQENLPGSIESGQTSLLAHDFFTPQIVENVSVFHLRAVTMDWPDKQVVTILKCIRSAALPTSRLIVSDFVIPLASEGADEAESRLAPAPLLPNLGKASITAYGVDMMVLVLANAQLRTLGHLRQLAKEAGWQIQDVRRFLETRWGYLIFSPI